MLRQDSEEGRQTMGAKITKNTAGGIFHKKLMGAPSKRMNGECTTEGKR